MATAKLHKGTFTRQALSGRQSFRITFIPDDTSQGIESVVRQKDDGEKKWWRLLLGNPHGINIDTGIVVVRFGKDNMSGSAFFMPEQAEKPTISKQFGHAEIPGILSIPTVGMTKFNACVDSKKRAAQQNHQPFDVLSVTWDCGPLLLEPE
jgi:hypothetical protein